MYGATIRDAVTALWEASDGVCGKRLVVMIPTLLPALERHGRLKLDVADRQRVLAISAATHCGPSQFPKCCGCLWWSALRQQPRRLARLRERPRGPRSEERQRHDSGGQI